MSVALSKSEKDALVEDTKVALTILLEDLYQIVNDPPDGSPRPGEEVTRLSAGFEYAPAETGSHVVKMCRLCTGIRNGAGGRDIYGLRVEYSDAKVASDGTASHATLNVTYYVRLTAST